MRHARWMMVVLTASAAVATAAAPTRPDALSPELRAKVEALKAAEAAGPSTAANFSERTDVLWDWGNAFALAGGDLPVNLPQLVASLHGAALEGAEPSAAQLAELDRFIKELTLKDDRPGAIGTVRFLTAGPLPADSPQTIVQEWTVGSAGMQPGGVLVVAKQLLSDQGVLQHTDPKGEGYLTIRSSNPGATFERTEVPWSGMHGSFRGGPQPLPAFRLAGAALAPGDTVTVTYGDRSGGSPGFKIQTWSTDRLLLPLYLDLDGSGLYLTPHWPALQVKGVEAAAARVVAPSVVAVGEAFRLVVRTEDRYSNRASAAIPAYQLLLDGNPLARIQAGGDPISVLSDLRIEQPGVHRFTVRADDGSITATSNPVWVLSDPPHRIYWGETHGHTDFAEGQGSPEHYFRWARQDALIDFATLSEHDVWMDDSEWQTLQVLTRRATEPGRFVGFLGYEWSVPRQNGGHHNVLFRTPDRKRVGIQRAYKLPDLYRLLAAENRPEDVVIIPHAHQAADWTQHDPDLERLVEMYSMHGTFEWFANFYLRNGFDVGFVGAADDHRSRPGYAVGIPQVPLAQLSGLAAVLAPRLTVDDVFDSMRSLSAYATSGQRIILDASLNGRPMGSHQPSTQERRLQCQVMGTAPIAHVDVVKNGDIVFSRRYLTAPLTTHSFLLVGFESSSEVFPPPRDNPRGYRVWDGTLRVEGARLVSVSTPGFDNRYLERATVDPTDPNLIHFRTETRGRRDTMLLEVDGASPETVLDVHLNASREEGGAPTLVRPPAQIPATDLELPLADLVEGRLDHELPVDRHIDRVGVEVIHPDGALDMSFEYADLGQATPGDYYYVRVTQLDGGQAWSSPFWVGQKEE